MRPKPENALPEVPPDAADEAAWPAGKPAAAGESRGMGPEDEATVAAYLGDPARLAVPPVESPFIESLLAASSLPQHVQDQARFYHEHGYLVLEDVFEPELIDELAARSGWLFDPATVFGGVPETIQRLLKLDAARRQDAWWVCEAVGRLACHPAILDLLRLFYGREPVPFQTLNFLHGTEQPTHSDSIHFSSLPARYMCGVWVALEDITEDNGPLVYFPGSHKLPDTQLEQLGLWGHPGETAIGPTYTLYENYLRALVKATGLRPERLTVKKGTALIWSANLLHGGSAIRRAGATRMSQVTHYYFQGCVYYAPIHSNTSLGEYRLKEIRDLRDQSRVVPHSINGQAVVAVPVSNGNSRLFLRGAADDHAARIAGPTRVGGTEDLRRMVEHLEHERGELLDQARALVGQRDDLAEQLGRLSADLSHHAANLEQALQQLQGGGPLQKTLRAVKGLFGGGPRDGG